MRARSRESETMTILEAAEAAGMAAADTQAVEVGLAAGMAAMAAGCIAEG